MKEIIPFDKKMNLSWFIFFLYVKSGFASSSLSLLPAIS